MLVRLNRALADLGIASRRKADELIAAGEVSVNGAVVTVLGTKVDPENDTIAVRNQVLERLERERVVVMLNKPAGVETTTVRRGDEPIILDFVRDIDAPVLPVGRLDKASRGLILMTNDGVLAYRLTHPKFEKEKEYLVRVAGVVTPEHLRQLRTGVRILGTSVKAAKVEQLGPPLLKIILTEGKNRQIRRMLRTLDLPVVDLQRVRVGPLPLGDLAEGRWRELTDEEVASLRGDFA